MAVLIGWVLLCIVMCLSILLTAIYLYSRQVYGYFKKRGIPYETPTFPFGNLTSVVTLKKSYKEILSQLYTKHKGKKFIGLFLFFQKSVLIIDRELIKQVLVKDFEHFNGKNLHYDKDKEPLSAHLFALDGSEWKFLRMKMTPVFSSGKLKAMYQTIADVTENLNEYVMKLSYENNVIECKEMFIRFGIATVSSTAFGLESDVFTNKSSDFVRVCEAIMSSSFNAMFRNALMFYATDIAKALKVRIIPKESHDFIMKLVTDVVQYREDNNEERKDFLQLLMEMKRGVRVENMDLQITMNELAAQAYVFILAGFEAISNTMSFFLYEMALNPEIQQRLFEEVGKPDTLTYDNLGAMEYLDMALHETMRKHVSLAFLARVCSQDYKVPGTDDVIEKGTNVLISTHGLHMDPDLFPEPELFDPERFNKENKANIKPYSYMPFGDGPRYCIASRFGKLAVKAGIAKLLRSFRVERTSKTPYPLKYDVRTVTTTIEGGMWLKMVPRIKEKNQ